MPNLVILNAGPDTAGCAIVLKRAFDRNTDWQTRAICRQKIYLDYETDIFWPLVPTRALSDQVYELVRAADVVHVMDQEYALRPFRRMLSGKAVVVQHLGSYYRRQPARITAKCRQYGATEVTDSIDLMLFPHITWLPVTADTEAMAKLRSERYRPSERIRIAHAPTNRAIKSTEVIIAAVQRLSRKYPLDFDLIEGVSNRECLERKALADIFVDQLTIGFGVNAIECWAMGIPVVSGLVDPEARRRAFELWGELPWADATPTTLRAQIECLIVDREWRAQLGEHGRQHGQLWHSPESVVRQTLEVYERAGLRVAA